MRHNSFQKIYASYIAPNPDMDVLWMDLKADPYGSVIKFWNGGVGKYELISSDASTIGKHIIYADDIELPVRSSINFKGFEITDDQPSDSMTISVEGKEDAGIAQSIVDSHELEFNHSDIHHENRAALNNVSGTNTGDQDLSGFLPIEHLSDFNHADISHDNRAALDSVSGVNTGDQDLSGLLSNSHLGDFNHNNINHANRYSLDLVSGINTGDQDLSGFVEKIADHSLVPDAEIDKLAEYPEFEDLEFSHENLTGKNSEAAVQHVDTTTTKETLDAADMVAIKDSVTGKVVLTKKSNIDESFKKLAVRRGAVFNEDTGFYELNGLTDITEAQMMDIYNYTSQSVFQYVQDEMLVDSPIRTTYNRPFNGAVGGTSMRYTYLNSQIEVYKCSLLVSTALSCFQNCLRLKTVDYLNITRITSAGLMLNMFQNCIALETCFLRNIKANLSFESSPLLSLASIQYIIQYRGNGTKQITITVHPTVFAKLTDNVNYPTWYAVAQDALAKFITFATL